MKGQIFQCLVFATLTILTKVISQSSSMPSGCSSIVPVSDSSIVCGSMNFTVARGIRDTTIVPKLRGVNETMTAVFDHSSLANINESELTFNSWRRGASHRLPPGEGLDGIVGASVNRLKCMVPAVADILANESVRFLVDEEESHFVSEFQSVLEDLDVLLDIARVVIGTKITACQLQVASCADYCILGREVQIKSVAYELMTLPIEVSQALTQNGALF